MTGFDAPVVSAVTDHMNGDHPEDNLLIARAFGRPGATASTMVSLDRDGGLWRVTDPSGEHELRVAWPAGQISERPEIRREVVSLYKAACARLGVPAREEHSEGSASPHAPAAHGAHGSAHGGGHQHGGAHPHGGHPHHASFEDDGSFSTELRTVTWSDHGDSEHSTFMSDIMRGQASLADYTAMVVQHYFMYVALEDVVEQFVADPHYAVFHPAELVRLPALEEDLQYLLGDDWRDQISPVPAVEAYVARIREVAAEGWKPGILAHHYTRYLGDLSGGQMIARRVVRQHGLTHEGVAFYDFATLGPIQEFKERYRAALDAIGESLSEDERQRMVDEVREAYRFNTQTFIDLDKARAQVAA